jgi:hypothetical protein
MTLDELGSSRWRAGPDFLWGDPGSWPQDFETTTTAETTTMAIATVEEVPVVRWERFSRYSRLVRTVAWILRWADRARGSAETGVLKAEELRRAEGRALILAQKDSFPKEVKLLQKDRPINTDSRVASMSPFLDTAVLLRARGR